jgi:sugar O-acyltransferase (sialic acid O-acetyltransferase NeuD family)
MKKKRGIVIFGIGPISKTIFYTSKKSGKYVICCFTADQKYIKTDTLCGLPIIAFEQIEIQFPLEKFDMLVVNMGTVAGTASRKDMFLRAKNKGYNLINYIDDKADTFEDLILGQNNIIMANTHIGPTGTMGDNNFIRENIYLGHDFYIGSHNVLAPGCNLGGSCKIGDLNFIGMGTTVINDIEIKDANLIGAGSLVVKNIGSCGKYIGHPVKRIAEFPQPGTAV